jgi:hypothetical protein
VGALHGGQCHFAHSDRVVRVWACCRRFSHSRQSRIGQSGVRTTSISVRHVARVWPDDLNTDGLRPEQVSAEPSRRARVENTTARPPDRLARPLTSTAAELNASNTRDLAAGMKA